MSEPKPLCKFSITLDVTVYARDEIVIQCKELPEAISEGANLQEAVANGVDAICEAIAGRVHRGEMFPWNYENEETKL